MRKFTGATILLFGAIFASLASAQDEVRKQGADFSPNIGLEALYDTNAYLQEADETDAFALLLKPGGELSYVTGASDLYLRYQGEFAKYDTTSKDDYFDHFLSTGLKLDLNSRNHLSGEAYYERDHVQFGFDRTENTPREDRDLDEYETKGVKGEYMFGAKEATINLGVYGQYEDLQYTSNRSETSFLDEESSTLGVRGIYNYSVRTQFLLDLENRDIEYSEATPGFSLRDATEQRILAGVRWVATGKTFGTVRVGHYSRDHDASDRDDFSGFDWDVSVGWAPTRRDVLSLQTARTTRESYIEIADFINTESIGVTWEHQWVQRFKTKLGYALFQAEFDGETWPGLTEKRQDDLNRFELIGTYEMSRNLTLLASYEYRERDSNDDSLDYDRNLVRVGIEARY